MSRQEYILIPVVGSLHFSLVIVCNPGVAPAGGACADAVAPVCGTDRPDAAAASHVPPLPQQEPPTPLILHLDSMYPDSAHNTDDICDAVRWYLQNEWARHRAAKAVAATASADAAAAGDQSTAAAAAAPAAAAGGKAAAADAPQPAVPPARVITAETFPATRLVLPQQDNSVDCGCFTVAYVEVRDARGAARARRLAAPGALTRRGNGSTS